MSRPIAAAPRAVVAPFFLLACLASIPASRPCAAAEPWDEPFAATAAQLLAGANAVSDKDADSAVVLLEEGRFSFDEAGRMTRSYRLVYRITSEDGVDDWGRVETGFAPLHQARPQMKARVVRPSGEEVWLDAATIDDTPTSDDPDLYDDQRMLRAPLPQLSIGVNYRF